MIDLGELPKGKYMETCLAAVQNRITPIYMVVEIFARSELGELKWYGPWRGFSFFPQNETVFDAECLKQIADWIEELNKRHREWKRGMK